MAEHVKKCPRAVPFTFQSALDDPSRFVKQPLRSWEDGPFTCDVCGSSFKLQYFYNKHRRNQHGDVTKGVQERSPMMMKSRDVPDCLPSATSATSLRSAPPMNQKSPKPVSTNIKKEKMKGPVGEGKMLKVICLQQSNGSFKLDGAISKILDISLDVIIEAGRKAKCPGELWSTLIAVSYLTLSLPQFRESWALVVEKANNWLGTQQFDETKMNRKAAKFVKAKLL